MFRSITGGPSSLQVFADIRLDDVSRLDALLATDPHSEVNRSDHLRLATAWKKWGQQCVDHLLGDFAFAIWDQGTGKLFCARDIIGTRPLFYCHTANGFWFASDIRQLLAQPGVPDTLNWPYITGVLRQTAFSHPTETCYQNISKLPPGHCLCIEANGALQLKQYWMPEEFAADRLPTSSDYPDQLAELIDRAVSDRMRTTSRIGVHVSGGLDCSLVAEAAARISNNRSRVTLNGFTWSQQEPASAPSPHTSLQLMDAVGQRSGLNITPCGEPTSELTFPALRDWSCEPHRDLISEHQIAHQAQQNGITLILSGWGGDEAASYNGAHPVRSWIDRRQWLRWWIHHWAAHQSNNPLVKSLGVGHLFFNRLAAKPAAPKPPGELSPFLNRETLVELTNLPLPSSPDFVNAAPYRSIAQNLSRGFLAHRMEHWYANGHRHGVGYAYPLTDRRILEFCLRLPDEQFVSHGESRRLMRQVAAKRLPEIEQAQKKDQQVVFDRLGFHREFRRQVRAHLDYHSSLPGFGTCLEPTKVDDYLREPIKDSNSKSNRHTAKKLLVALATDQISQNHRLGIWRTNLPQQPAPSR